MNRKQLTVLSMMIAAYALTTLLTYALFVDQLAATAGIPMPEMGVSDTVLGLANAGIVLVAYGLLGLGGYWLARKLNLPGIYSEDGNWRRWFLIPLLLGLACGLFLLVGDVAFARINGFGRLVHPAFPLSILASIGAGIGEEIMFRGFVFGLWAFLLDRLFQRLFKHAKRRTEAFWVANGIAALAFGAGHLGTVLVLTGASSLSALDPVLIAEVFLLNGVVGLVAGERYMRDGLVAAAGVHFWADIVFHVLWGVL
ncbi:MAG: CPBP family intramembrane metalloprotease [Ardenticatenales bacterium]|nr:CPBP family intramembrane metalloprotease [Ardenticatenales bacterium]